MGTLKKKGKNSEVSENPKKPKASKKISNVYKEKRSEKRIKKRLLVSLNGEDFMEMAITSDISKNGLFIESANILPLNEEILVMLKTNEDLFNLKCEVKWVKRPSKLMFKNKKTGGMGIKIIEAPAEYLNYVAYTKYENQLKINKKAE